MIYSLMNEKVDVVRLGPGDRDELGRPTTTEISRRTYRARLEQAASQETGEVLVNRWTAYLPPTADVHADDVVEFNGLEFLVDGDASLKRVPGFPGASHVLVSLARRES